MVDKETFLNIISLRVLRAGFSRPSCIHAHSVSNRSNSRTPERQLHWTSKAASSARPCSLCEYRATYRQRPLVNRSNSCAMRRIKGEGVKLTANRFGTFLKPRASWRTRCSSTSFLGPARRSSRHGRCSRWMTNLYRPYTMCSVAQMKR